MPTKRVPDFENANNLRYEDSREMAGATGFEPATSCLTGRHSNQLNYAPANRVLPTTSTSYAVLLGPARPFE